MKTRSYTLPVLKSLVHATGKFEQETVMFDFVLTAGGSATTQVVKSHGSHVPVETSGAECVGTCCRDTVVKLVFLFWFTEHITVVS